MSIRKHMLELVDSLENLKGDLHEKVDTEMIDICITNLTAIQQHLTLPITEEKINKIHDFLKANIGLLSNLSHTIRRTRFENYKDFMKIIKKLVRKHKLLNEEDEDTLDLVEQRRKLTNKIREHIS